MVPPIFALLVGLILTVAPGFSVAQNFQPFMGQPWADFVASNARLGAFISLLSRVLGVQLIIHAIVAIAITLTSYRRGEKGYRLVKWGAFRDIISKCNYHR